MTWEPNPKQLLAMRCNADQIFYGGSAGGGKSSLALALNVRGAFNWGKDWHAIIFRKTYPQLDELVRQGREMFLPLGATYKEQKHTFIFPSGADVQLRSLERDVDVEKYQGHQYTLIVFDELGNWPTDYCWVYMQSRLRSTIKGIHCQLWGTGNPGGVGNAWIKNKFIDGFRPNISYKIPIAKGADGAWQYIRQCYIPARLADNPYLAKNNPQYEIQLRALPEHLRRALLEGDWDVIAGQAFSEWRRERHVTKAFALPPTGWFKFYAMDWGYNKPYALVKLAVSRDGKVVQYGELYGCKKGEVNKGVKESSIDAAARVWSDALDESVSDLVADPACWNKQDGFPAPIDAFADAGFRTIKANHDRIAGLQVFHDYLQQEDENGLPMFQVFATCYHTIRTLPALLPDPHKPEDIDSSMEDHIYDAIRYGLMSRFVSHPDSNLLRAPIRRAAAQKRWYQ
jgi:hypothetical protein